MLMCFEIDALDNDYPAYMHFYLWPRYARGDDADIDIYDTIVWC